MSEWKETIARGVNFRRALHRQPELTWKEFETARRVREELDSLNIAWRHCAETGTVATLASRAPGKHIALRADMDALPIEEAVEDEWRSRVPGCMHACGHDGHSAVLMAAAAWLKRHEQQLPGPVSLLFQPAEEGGHGARRMIEDGALEGVAEIYGWHNWPAIPYGRALCPNGAVMAGNGTFHIDLKGRGGHASQPEACRDPVLAAAAVTLALQQIVSRRTPPNEAAVVSVASIDGRSNSDTIIPEQVRLSGSIRVTQLHSRDRITRWIQQIAQDTAATYGVEASLEFLPRYNPTRNHPVQAQTMGEAFATEYGEDWQFEELPTPIMASEDFSYYLEQIPGAFALVGMHRDGDFLEPCHSPHYRFNDDLIPHVVKVFARLAGAPVPAGSQDTRS